MRIADHTKFVEERRRYLLVHTCEGCVYRDHDRDACAHGYPDAMHREAAFEADGAGDGMFCKEFELA
jgi:hypothetical protein